MVVVVTVMVVVVFSWFHFPRYIFLVTSSSFRLFSARFPSAFSVRFSLADPLIFRLTFLDFRLSLDRLTPISAVFRRPRGGYDLSVQLSLGRVYFQCGLNVKFTKFGAFPY